jgi:fused signal recognition particle receptor
MEKVALARQLEAVKAMAIDDSMLGGEDLGDLDLIPLDGEVGGVLPEVVSEVVPPAAEPITEIVEDDPIVTIQPIDEPVIIVQPNPVEEPVFTIQPVEEPVVVIEPQPVEEPVAVIEPEVIAEEPVAPAEEPVAEPVVEEFQAASEAYGEQLAKEGEAVVEPEAIVETEPEVAEPEAVEPEAIEIETPAPEAMGGEENVPAEEPEIVLEYVEIGELADDAKL